MQIASIQMAVVENDKAATLAKAADNIRHCGGADLIILPEIWNVGFMSFDRYIPEAEEANGETLELLRGLARETGSHIHSGSFVEKSGDRYTNASRLISPDGEIQAVYRKIHLFGYNSKETQILTPGDSVVVVETPLGKIGMAACYDLRFPELFRAMVDQGAEIFLVCSAWPYPRLEPWLMFNRVRALENQCFLVSSNSVGMNQGTQFVGHSMIVNPWGTILAGGGDEEIIVRANIDLSDLRDARKRFPALADRVDMLNAGGYRALNTF